MSYDRKGLLNRLKQFEQGKSRPPKEGEEFNPNISYGIWDAINLHTVLDAYKYRGEGEAVNID